MNDVRDVPLDDVTWKVQATGERAEGKPWCMWVAYADARVYGERLDAWAGDMGWSDAYNLIDVGGKAAVECAITIHTQDLGTEQAPLHIVRHGWAEIEGGREVVKGAESDAFKRAGSKCGVGRNLYRLPRLYTDGEKRGDKIIPPREVKGQPVAEWLMAQVEEVSDAGAGE